MSADTDIDIEGRLKNAYGAMDASPGLAAGLFDAIEDSRLSVPSPTRRWPLVLAVAGVLLFFGLAGLGYLLHDFGGSGQGRDPGWLPGPAAPETTVESERTADQKAYDAAIAGLKKEHAGEWVVIANGRVEKTGRAMADVLPAAPGARHRFVWKVGEEGDREEFASEWYGPRFSGTGLVVTLGVDWSPSLHEGVRLSKDGKTFGPFGAPPFPRVPIRIGRRVQDSLPDSKDSVVWNLKELDVFIGTVGPPLMLMPEDWDALRLARNEIPGTMKVFDGPCRMATVEVAVPELGAQGALVAACPSFPRERLVDMARWRDAFWTKYWQLQQEVTKGYEGKWIVYAADRVVGSGASVAQAMADASQKPDGCYHRYVLKLPREESVEFDAASFTEGNLSLWKGVPGMSAARANAKGEILVPREVADRLHLEMAEDGRDILLVGRDECWLARGGWVWEGIDITMGQSAPFPPLRYVLYKLDPKPPTPLIPPK